MFPTSLSLRTGKVDKVCVKTRRTQNIGRNKTGLNSKTFSREGKIEKSTAKGNRRETKELDNLNPDTNRKGEKPTRRSTHEVCYW